MVSFDSSIGAVGEGALHTIAITVLSLATHTLTPNVHAGDNQGFLVLTSGDYEVSMPLWARVLAPTPNTVLLLNAEGLSGATTPALVRFPLVECH